MIGSWHGWWGERREGAGGERLPCLSFSSSPSSDAKTYARAPSCRRARDARSPDWMLNCRDQIKPQWDSQVKISRWWIRSAPMPIADSKYYFRCESEPLAVNKNGNELLHCENSWKALSNAPRGLLGLIGVMGWRRVQRSLMRCEVTASGQ